MQSANLDAITLNLDMGEGGTELEPQLGERAGLDIIAGLDRFRAGRHGRSVVKVEDVDRHDNVSPAKSGGENELVRRRFQG